MHTPISQEFASPPLLKNSRPPPPYMVFPRLRGPRAAAAAAEQKLAFEAEIVWRGMGGFGSGGGGLCLKIRPWFPLPGTSPSEKSEGAFYLVLSFPPFPEYNKFYDLRRGITKDWQRLAKFQRTFIKKYQKESPILSNLCF